MTNVNHKNVNLKDALVKKLEIGVLIIKIAILDYFAINTENVKNKRNLIKSVQTITNALITVPVITTNVHFIILYKMKLKHTMN